MNWSTGEFVAKTFFGLEEVLADEAKELGLSNVKVLNRAVSFEGGYKDMIRANYALRTALAILKPIKEFKFREKDDFYQQIKDIPWEKVFDPQKTFVIKGAVRSKTFPNSQFPILVCKDAIVDRFKEKTGTRPDIHTKRAAIVIDIFVHENQARISLNTSGTPLFQRGYRQETGRAPLNEVLAAGLIRMTGWKADRPFYDLFCGSGTICIEAGLMAHGLPPQLERKYFAFMHYKNFRHSDYEDVKAEFPSRPKREIVPIVGVDINTNMIRTARTNLRGTSLAKTVTFEAKDFRDVVLPEDGGVIVSNPPYGERIGDNVEELYADLGTFIKHKAKGFDSYVISSSREALNEIGLRPSRKWRVFNGKLECSYRKYETFKGTMKEFKTEKSGE